MKKLILIIVVLLGTKVIKADVAGHVLQINAPESIGEDYEVLTSDRNVLRVSSHNIQLIENLYEAKENDSLVNLTTNDSVINELKLIEIKKEIKENDQYLHPMIDYTPSIISNIDQADEMFQSLNNNTKWFSQCFNRAHIWSKQLFDQYSTKSMKILIYYTKKYRREVDGKWWFHIAPMINVAGQRMVLDREFTRKPLSDNKWENIFTAKMKSKGINGYRCKVIKNISEYYDEDNQNHEYCNIQVTSMYYWEPSDMSRLEKNGTQKTDFINWQLRVAAKEAFKKWKKVYRVLKQ